MTDSTESPVAKGGIDSPPSLGYLVPAFGDLLASINAFAAVAGELVEALAELHDEGGRPIWLYADGVKLDSWTARVAVARDALVEHLR